MHKYIILLLVLLTVYVLSAQNSDTFESRMAEFGIMNKTIQCDFLQQKKVRNIKNIHDSKGEFYYDNSGKIAMLYDNENGDKVVMNGDKFVVVTAGKSIRGKSDDNPMMGQICNMLQACMSGDVSKLGRGWDKFIEDEGGVYRITLTPIDRRTRKYIESLLMIFDKSSMTLNELKINEMNGGYTAYVFDNKVLNEEIDPRKFE